MHQEQKLPITVPIDIMIIKKNSSQSIDKMKQLKIIFVIAILVFILMLTTIVVVL
jgi:hypothetical protein